MAILFRPGMDSIMLDARRGFEIFGMITLQTLHEGRRHLTRQEGIFPPRFLSSPPAWIAKNVDIRRPESKSLILIGIAVATERGMIFCPPLIADGGCDSMDQFFVPGCRHADRLRENSGASVAGNTMQCLTPIIVGGDVQAWHALRRVIHQAYFFIDS